MARIISSPRLLTADQTQAVIEQGTEYLPYTQTAPNGATTIAFKKAVLKLEVVPQITPEGNIIMDLDLNKDSRGETTLQGVAIDTKHIKTQVLVENGGTVVIGGIFEMEETNQVNKVPVLGISQEWVICSRAARASRPSAKCWYLLPPNGDRCDCS